MVSEQYGVPTTVLRFFTVYGPGQQANGGGGVVTIFARRALAGEPLVVQSAGRRDLCHAQDAAAASRWHPTNRRTATACTTSPRAKERAFERWPKWWWT